MKQFQLQYLVIIFETPLCNNEIHTYLDGGFALTSHMKMDRHMKYTDTHFIYTYEISS